MEKVYAARYYLYLLWFKIVFLGTCVENVRETYLSFPSIPHHLGMSYNTDPLRSRLREEMKVSRVVAATLFK